MLDFVTWRLQEAFDLVSIRAYQPKDAKWVPPLDEPGDHTFYFNVPGDDCGPNRPCYKVSISNGDNANISFKRTEGSFEDENRGVGTDVMMGVLKGIGEYIETVHPRSLSWSAIEKTSARETGPNAGRIVNPEARAHVYDAWAVRNLFPHMYIGAKEGRWVRTDIYNNEYVPRGYPPIPEGVTADSNAGVKRKALEQMRTQAEESSERIRQAEEAVRRQEQERREREREERERIRREREAEEERVRQERIQQAVNDPEQNPEHFQVGDIVYLAEPQPHTEPGILGKIP